MVAWQNADDYYESNVLVRAMGVLIPQRLGLGMVTRLSVMACAGIPVAVSRCPARAFEHPPGMFIAGEEIEEWVEAMTVLACRDSRGAEPDEYVDRAAKQSNGLTSVISNYLSTVTDEAK